MAKAFGRGVRDHGSRELIASPHQPQQYVPTGLLRNVAAWECPGESSQEEVGLTACTARLIDERLDGVLASQKVVRRAIGKRDDDLPTCLERHRASQWVAVNCQRPVPSSAVRRLL